MIVVMASIEGRAGSIVLVRTETQNGAQPAGMSAAFSAAGPPCETPRQPIADCIAQFHFIYARMARAAFHSNQPIFAISTSSCDEQLSFV